MRMNTFLYLGRCYNLKQILLKSILTIDDVINQLDNIIQQSQVTNSPLGYFAALYRKVTIKVKEGIKDGVFEDGPRMEKLDIIFATRYLEAYFAYQKKQPITNSWQIPFNFSKQYWPLVLQHLLVGMNAHISLDLGIAAATVSKGENIEDLKNDFNTINTILSDLVLEVENDLAKIWPTLHTILRFTRKVDNFLVNFSMELARDGAWKFAVQLANSPEDKFKETIEARDYKVAKKTKLISNPGVIAGFILGIIRIGERGSITGKIEVLKN